MEILHGKADLEKCGGRTARDPGKTRLWQPDYWDRFIRNKRHYHATVEYIHQNPVKAGLVAHAEDWPWSSMGALAAGVNREKRGGPMIHTPANE